jgi:alpha-glucosidase
MTDHMTSAPKAPNNQWWRGGVIYQIYPRSFADSNGDGIGDLPGITARLPYIADLGVDAIWLSPFFKSPMKDFGYDVSDYCDVDPMFGTLGDFKALVARAHELGLKVMIDQVLSHTSDQHPWFVQSREDARNDKADWYVWADPRHDGGPPNNWLSVFGGSAWQFDTRRGQYYLHNFLASQPDLNFHNAAVRQALLDSVRFWLDLGVDGFRLDTANFYFHDTQLRDNPGRGRPSGEDPAVPTSNPYVWQWHVYDKSRPENLVFLKHLRKLLDEYPHTTLVGEIGCDNSLQRMAEYTSGGDKLHMAYSFDLLGPRHDAPYVHDVLNQFQTEAADGWPSWALSNHDCTRLATRWAANGQQASLAESRVFTALQLSLRGSPCLYQGDELGLAEADIAFEDLQDPYGITMWPRFKGRDGCRTPMPWQAAAADMGFGHGTAKPWLPLADSHRARAADAQVGVPGSLHHHYQHLLRWRRTQPVLARGTMQLLPAHAQVLAHVRELDGQRLFCAFNLSTDAAVLPWPEGLGAAAVVAEVSHGVRQSDDGTLQFEPHGVLFARLP